MKGAFGCLVKLEPGPPDATSARLVCWFTSSARLRAYNSRLWRNVGIGCFSGARLQRCKRKRMGCRTEEHADTRNHFFRCACNRTASEGSLYACVREPNKELSHLASLARASLAAVCKPGSGHTQTKHAQNCCMQECSYKILFSHIDIDSNKIIQVNSKPSSAVYSCVLTHCTSGNVSVHPEVEPQYHCI